MKRLFKGLGIVLFILLIGATFFCIYILSAPPIAEQGTPTLQVHEPTDVRGRPTVNSKPILKTKSQFLFSIDKIYLSNLTTGTFSKELLFSIPLGQRARYSSELLDKELGSDFNWQKMFKDAGGVIQLASNTTRVKVLLTGRDWILTDNIGQGFSIERNRNELDIYLPNLNDELNSNKITLSDDVEFTVERKNKLWLIKDHKTQQAYEIHNAAKKLQVFQQSKYPIQTRLLKLDRVAQTTLNEGTLPKELFEGFKKQEIPLSNKAKLTTGEDTGSWQISDGSQKYNIVTEDGWLQVSLDLDSQWLFLRIGSIEGWTQRERGTVIIPHPPILSSRQQLKEKMIASYENFKVNVGITKKPELPQNIEITE